MKTDQPFRSGEYPSTPTFHTSEVGILSESPNSMLNQFAAYVEAAWTEQRQHTLCSKLTQFNSNRAVSIRE